MATEKEKAAEGGKAEAKVEGSKKVSGAEGLIPASETAGAETAGGTVRLRDPEPVPDSTAGDDAGDPPPEDHTITNEPIEIRGMLRNPKAEQLGAVGELDPKGRSPEEFRLDQQKRERQRQARRRSRRAERRSSSSEASAA